MRSQFKASLERTLPVVELFVRQQVGRSLLRYLDADDVLQEVALVAYRSADKLSFKSDQATLAWLKLTARRVTADLSRRAHTQLSWSSPQEEPENCSAEKSPDPLESVASAEERERALQGLATLSLTDRSLLSTLYLEGMDRRAVARECNCSVPAVRTRAHRALLRLRSRLKVAS